MTCQWFQHSPNLFGDCGAYGVWPTKSFHAMLLRPLCVLSHMFSARVMSDQREQIQILYIWRLLWSKGHRICENIKERLNYGRTQTKHRKAKKRHGWTKLERIKMDCIWVKLKIVGPTFFKFSLFQFLLKTGSLYTVIQGIWLAQRPWYMSHYTMPYKYGKRTLEFLGAFLFPFQSSGGVLIKQLFHSRLLEMRWLYPTRARGIIVKDHNLLYGKAKPSVLIGSSLVGILPCGPFPWKRL